MQNANFRKTIYGVLIMLASITGAAAQRATRASGAARIPTNTLLRIMRAEDERRWDDSLSSLLRDQDARVRRRATLAAGRIGDERAVPALVEVLRTDTDNDVRQMAAFAIGETESFTGAAALYTVLGDTSAPPLVVARAVEALGKIAAALPESDKDHKSEIGKAILGLLRFEGDRRVSPDRLTVLLGLTATLRARPEGAGPVVVQFLSSQDSRIVADALNTMARLRLKDANERVRQLLSNGDAIVRANAARVIGAKEDKEAFDALIGLALNDNDVRVRVSAIRALGSLKDVRAAKPLLDWGINLLGTAAKTKIARPAELNELLEIATVLGSLLKNTNSAEAVSWLRDLRKLVDATSPTVEISLARIAPQEYMSVGPSLRYSSAEQQGSLAQGLAEVASAKTGQPILDNNLREFVTNLAHGALVCQPRKPGTPAYPSKVPPGSVLVGSSCTALKQLAVPEFLRAYAAVKPERLEDMLRQRLKDPEVNIRATAADLLGDLPPSEVNTRALIEALPTALGDKSSNDAVLTILDSLAKLKSQAGNEAIKTGFNSPDILVRRRAVTLLKANGVGDFSDRIGAIKTRNTDADYKRALARADRKVIATLVTTKGSFTIEFFPEQAPLTVDNFVQLARRGYFNGISFHRVVPNFVIQGGDPRGDGNGGPGYQIRCEINEAPYDRAAVGMALSGKDTGGSQWFVTHSPQPHLDGGYTVFGRVTRGMDVVDNIARGDKINRVIVNER